MAVFFRNETVIVSCLALLSLQILIAFYSGSILSGQDYAGRAVQFNFMRNHLLIFFFPVIAVNILVLAFSLTTEKHDLMLAKMIPYGENSFIRSKIMLSSIVSASLGFTYLILVFYTGGMSAFMNAEFLIFLFFYLLFSVISISTFSVFYSVSFFDRQNSFEPGIRGIVGLMFFVTLTVVLLYALLLRNLKAYYEFVMGFEKYYPNRFFISSIMILFGFLIATRIMFNSAEKIYMSK